jgi:rSAM/selenodomain-associated transferase 1
MTPAEVTLAVIAKTPVPGRVKTRLCPPCTGEQAASIAEAALRDTLDAVAATSAGRRAVVLDGDRPAWIGPEFEVIGQRGDGLDERLGAAFVDLDAPVVIIGMDTPQVTSDLLDQVIATLCRGGVDAVLGPANDGGYWVVGLRTPTPSAVEGVPMSVGWTCAAQLDRLDSLGLRTALVQELTDLDTFDEAVEVAAVARGRRFPAAMLAVRTLLGTR